MGIKSFVRNESGAVTVDWVVLTAAIVGIAIAVLTVIAGGINTSANTTTTSLNSADSVASLIGGDNSAGPATSSYSSWQDYLDANEGNSFFASLAVDDDAPEGSVWGGSIDNATGAPVYYTYDVNENHTGYSVAGVTYSTADYNPIQSSQNISDLE